VSDTGSMTAVLGHARRHPDGLAAAFVLSFLATAGIFYVNIMPALVSGLIEGLGFDRRSAGLVGSANIYGAAFGALAISFVVARLDWRRAAVLLLLGLLALDALSLAVRTVGVLIPLRAAHGVVGGMLVGVAFAVIARTRVPDRAFGMLLLVQFGLGGLGVMTLPGLVPTHGTGVLFVALMLFSAVSLAMLPLLGRYPPRSEGEGDRPRRASPASRTRYLLALAALFLFQAANMGLFTYIIELGLAAGLDKPFISRTVGIATWVGTAGCLAVIALGTRHGRALPLALGLVVTLVGIWALHHSDLRWVFVLSNCATGITWSLVMPYLLGLAAAFDDSGRAAAFGGFASKLGLATGPFIGAMFLQGDDYGLLIDLACVGIVLCVAAALWPARALDRADA
jgi:predicted MFS family arabinose efflux permease